MVLILLFLTVITISYIHLMHNMLEYKKELERLSGNVDELAKHLRKEDVKEYLNRRYGKQK